MPQFERHSLFTGGKAIVNNEKGQTHKPPAALVAVLIVLVLLTIPSVFYYSRVVTPAMRFVLIVIAALFSALLLFFGSRATASGKIVGVSFHFQGAFAAFIVFVLAFHWVFPQADTTLVRVFLERQGRPLPVDFSIIARIPGTETIQKQGNNGETTFELPSRFTQIDGFVITCPGYTLFGSGPFPIADGVVRLTMIKDERPAPLKPADLPSISAIPNLPSQADVQRPPTFRPEDVTLLYRNICGQNLRLILLDCSRYYATVSGKAPGRDYWADIVFDASTEFTPYNSFRSGTGWFCLFVRDNKGNNTYLGRKNLFEQQAIKLTVKPQGDRGFLAVFE